LVFTYRHLGNIIFLATSETQAVIQTPMTESDKKLCLYDWQMIFFTSFATYLASASLPLACTKKYDDHN
jgi:hypothetical protein